MSLKTYVETKEIGPNSSEILIQEASFRYTAQKIMTAEPDILEDYLNEKHHIAFVELLKDHTTGKNIFWGTKSYIKKYGIGYSEIDEITIDKITGPRGRIIQPRAVKERAIQTKRAKDMAEVFTPSWLCNSQNNLIDNAWFEAHGYGKPRSGGWFNDDQKEWIVNPAPVFSPGDDNWKKYVMDIRLEITCGEAPYIVSRYDAVNPNQDGTLPIDRRVGILDRKLRIVHENIDSNDKRAWLVWAKKAVQSVYGYEWQGDNLLIARESVFFSYIDYFEQKFGTRKVDWKTLKSIARIISWNLWQMDGLTMTVPNSCGDKATCINQNEINKARFNNENLLSLFQNEIPEPIFEVRPCEGCRTGDITKHNGEYCLIRDWQVTEQEDRKNPRHGDLKKPREEELKTGAIVKFYTLVGNLEIN
jgi:hypothetical protein